jgi:hypothetical protein
MDAVDRNVKPGGERPHSAHRRFDGGTNDVDCPFSVDSLYHIVLRVRDLEKSIGVHCGSVTR